MILKKISHVLGKHSWIYSGKRGNCSDGSYTITGTRYCWYCEKREYFWFGPGKKAGWYPENKPTP